MARKSKAYKIKLIAEQLSELLAGMRKKKRLEVIDDFLHSLNFDRRVAMLTSEEMAHMCNQSLSLAQRKRLDEASTEKKRDEIFMEYARANYFRRCAWADYLNGVTDKKPFVHSAKKEQTDQCVSCG